MSTEIPEAATKSANRAVYREFKGLIRPALVQAALEAAAPFIRAQALTDAAEALRQAREDIDPWGKPTVENYADWIEARAALEVQS